MQTVKKVFKIILKVILGILGTVLGFIAVCAVVTLCWSAVQISKGTVTDTLPETPDDFTPTVRAIIFTDSHKAWDRLGTMFDTAYELFDNDETYPGIDGFFGLGDFSSIGTEPDYDSYISVLKEHVRPETPIVDILGNHETKQSYARDMFTEKFGYEPDTVTKLNGFTFIALSSYPHITEWTYPVSVLKWASEQLEIAEEEADGKAVFVLQHPHNFGTVYGSSIWCSPQTNPIWAGHSCVVNFSGHSHFPMNDPRSINQTTYTSVGVGAMATFELDDTYLVGQHPDGYDTANEFCVLEADNDGSVRIRGYDLNSDTYFCDWYIDNVNDTENYAYTYKNMKAHDTAPVFSEDTEATAKKNENEEWVLSFADAQSAYIVHDYYVTITDENGKTVFKDNFVNDYYVIDETKTAHLRLGKDTLESGKQYTATIVAKSAYHLKSEPISLAFTAE